MGKKKKQNSLSIVERGSAGNFRVERYTVVSSLPCHLRAGGMVKSQPVLLLRVISGSKAVQQYESVAQITSLDHVEHSWLRLPPGTTLMAKGCAELALPITGCGTLEIRPHPSPAAMLGGAGPHLNWAVQ